MLKTIIDKNQPKISSSTSNPNHDAATLDAAADKENLAYILKFGLPLHIAQYINLRLI